MASRPFVDFAEVKRRISLPEVLDVFGILGQFRATPDGTKLSGVCPLPAHQHGPSPNADQFKIDLKDGIWLWHCFGDCQTGGDVIEFVKKMTGYSDAHARLWFADKYPHKLSLKKPAGKKTGMDASAAPLAPPPADPPQAPAERSRPGPLKPLKFYLNLSLEAALPYLQQRGVSPEVARRYGLGICSKGSMNGYLCLPVTTPDSDAPVAYLGRWPQDLGEYPDERPRYKWPKEFEHNRVLLGIRQALTNPGPLVVVEGLFGLLHVAQAGYPAVVAVAGSFLSDEQADLLAATGRSVVLLFDGDEAGQHGMRLAAGKLITRVFLRAVKLDPGQQPDHLPAEQLRVYCSFFHSSS